MLLLLAVVTAVLLSLDILSDTFNLFGCDINAKNIIQMVARIKGGVTCQNVFAESGDCASVVKTRTSLWGVASWIKSNADEDVRQLYAVNVAKYGHANVASASMYDNLNWLIPGSPGG